MERHQPTSPDIVEKCLNDEIIPNPYWPSAHPITAIVAACEEACRLYLARCGPDQYARWVAARQEVGEVVPAVVTICRFELCGFDAAQRQAFQMWMQAHLESVLGGLPNLEVEIV